MLITIGLFIVGIFVGIYASVVGGGALLLVPFFSLLGTPITVAIGTMRASAVVQEGVSAITFASKKSIEWGKAIPIGFCTVIGGYAGARLVLDIDRRIVAYVVAATLVSLLILVPIVTKRQRRQTNDSEPVRPTMKFSWWLIVPISVALGVYGGFYGGAFGTLMLFFFTFVGGSSLLESAGNARVIGFLMSLAAAFVFTSGHLIDWSLFVPMTFGLIIGSVIGVKAAVRYGASWIRWLLTAVVIASAIKLVIAPG
jgi:hypothetical protein